MNVAFNGGLLLLIYRVMIKMTLFWDAAPCELVAINRRLQT
jgi:hypothetical protein